MKEYKLKELASLTGTTIEKIQSFRLANLIYFKKISKRKIVYTDKSLTEIKTILKFEDLKKIFKSALFKNNNITFHNTSDSVKDQLRDMKNKGIQIKKPAIIDMILNDYPASLEERFTTYYSKTTPSPTLINFKLRYGEKLGEQKYNEKSIKLSKSLSLDGFIKRYGEKLGEQKYNEKSINVSKALSLDGFIKRYGEKEGKIKYQQYKQNNGFTFEKCIKKYGEKEGKKRWKEYRKKSAHTKENFIKRYGEKEGKIKYQQYKQKLGLNLENCIKLYGEKEGKNIYEKRVKQLKNMNNPDFFIKKYGEKKGLEIVENRKNTKENFIKRYGEKKGIEKWEKHIKNIKNTKENFIRVHGPIEGAKKWEKFKKISANTKENFIRVHGLKEGTKRWDKYKSSQAGYKASKESLEFFEPITNYLLKKGVRFDDIFFGVKDSFEYKIEDGEKLHSYDYTILSLKLIFEYNGSHVHPSKEKLTESEWQNWKSPWTEESADEKYELDQNKIKAAENQGFTVMEIWDYENPDETFDKCIKLINEKI